MGVSDVWRDATFRLRSVWRWSPRPPATPLLELAAIRGALHEEGRARFDGLATRCDLSPLCRARHVFQAREGLWALDVLRSVLPQALPSGRALDVGAKNGALLPGLWAALPRDWDLVELDAHRRYANLTTRRAHGELLAGRFPTCRYLAADVLSLGGTYACITWMLPFVVEHPLEAWGLPRRLFMPARLLEHVLSLLAPGGVLLIVNQGEREAEVQQRLLEEAGARFDALGLLPQILSPYLHPRYGFRVEGDGR